jgi:hypothetical protein
VSLNSRSKGKRGEQEFINLHLRQYWPQAARNVDQSKDRKEDVVEVAGCHWQIKRTEQLRLWSAIEQAETEAAEHDLPIVAFRRNHSPWYCVVEASELVALLRLREAA